MFVQTSSNQKQRTHGANQQQRHSSTDELMFDLEDISNLSNTTRSEVQELALDVVSKMVESWLDPNLVQDQQCTCGEDVLLHMKQFTESISNIKGPNFNQNQTYAEEEVHNKNLTQSEKRSNNRVQDSTTSGFDSNEKRPRCNTGDKTASRCSEVCNQEIVVDREVPDEYFDLVALHLPIILRLCLACPFGKVREKCRGILKVIKARGLPIPFPSVLGPSEFICSNKTHTLFVDAFLQNNRLDHVSQVMGYHPSYLEHFLKTQNFILRGDGPLPFDYRHYIAIMASGRHQCSYLIALQKQEFLAQGGDQNWLRGLKYIPQKLRNLYDINKILAHRPWLLRTSHIEKLTKCGKDSWSLAEVVHAIVILTHFHSLCSFVFSCGVNQELDQMGGYEYPAGQGPTGGNSQTRSSVTVKGRVDGDSQREVAAAIAGDWTETLTACPPSPTEPEVGISTLMQRMKTLSEQTEECTPVELAKRFENIEVQSAELGVIGPEPQETPADISYFVDDPGFQYQDFAKRAESDIHTFRVQDYSWDDHGYSTVNRLYNDVGTLLDSKFKTAYNLTYYTMGGRTDVDTSRFRRAIWNYIQALLGIRHDDYDYGEINALVEKSLKSFIKTACCYPERVTKKVYDRVMREFQHSEKVHVNLMVLESRMQAELIYALRTVNRYMTM
ncbi:hypothetical protein ABEB36_001468 [Hypothenemus hampei]|uniref:Sestrin n=1 Tax=Hypothenemus hampei TaxID=57062 RepID=A0ABD1FEQ0_HYPHA